MCGHELKLTLLTVIAAAVLLSACTAELNGERGTEPIKDSGVEPAASETSTGPRVISREIPPDDPSAGIVIGDVRAASETTLVFVGRATTQGDDAARREFGCYVYTSDASVGPGMLVPVNDLGVFEVALEFPLEHRGDVWAYDVALVGGRRVYLNLDEGLWTVGEGGTFQPIDHWRR